MEPLLKKQRCLVYLACKIQRIFGNCNLLANCWINDLTTVRTHDSHLVLTWGRKSRIKSEIYYLCVCVYAGANAAGGTHPTIQMTEDLKPFAPNQVPNFTLELFLLFVGLHSGL